MKPVAPVRATVRLLSLLFLAVNDGASAIPGEVLPDSGYSIMGANNDATSLENWTGNAFAAISVSRVSVA